MSVNLSVIIPVYNERNSILEVIERVKATEIDLEIIVVDDASTDGTTECLRGLEHDSQITLCYHEYNQGKGAAIRTGIHQAQNDLVLVQDADLEYSPSDYVRLIQPFVDYGADVVFGSRFSGGECHRVLYFWHSLGNKLLTTLSNLFTNLNLTDMEVCYKVFKRTIIQNILIEEKRFGFEPEITAKIAHHHKFYGKRLKIFEVGVTYDGRTYAEGKKINWKDGFSAIRCILKYNIRLLMKRQIVQ